MLCLGEGGEVLYNLGLGWGRQFCYVTLYGVGGNEKQKISPLLSYEHFITATSVGGRIPDKAALM